MLVTPRQLMFLQGALGSLDDTLDEKEVLAILNAMPPDFSMIPREELRLIHIDGDFKITTYPARRPPTIPTNTAGYTREGEPNRFNGESGKGFGENEMAHQKFTPMYLDSLGCISSSASPA
jgi:hypothetical protein